VTTDPQPPADEVTLRLQHLRAMLGDLDGYIQRRAEDLAVPIVRDAEARARLAVTDAAGETQRLRDLVEELRKRIAVADRQRDEMNAARRILAAALGEPAGALPLSYFADRVTGALTVHQCPAIGIMTLPCCGRDAGEIREPIRVSTDPGKVTCEGKSSSEESSDGTDES
jgi:hypothetical protein